MVISRVEVPAGTFEGQTEPFGTWGNPGVWGVKDVFPEDLAYEFTKLSIESADKLEEYGAKFEIASPEVRAYGLTKRTLHPGALRAFEELGYSIPD